MPLPSSWSALLGWPQSRDGSQRGGGDEAERVPLTASADRTSADVVGSDSAAYVELRSSASDARLSSRAVTVTTPAPVTQPVTSSNSYYLKSEESWTVVRVERRQDELEIRLFSSYARTFTLTGAFGLASLGMYHVFRHLVAAPHWSVMKVIAASSLMLVAVSLYLGLLKMWLDTVSIERLVVSGSEVRIENVFGVANRLLKRFGWGRSLTLHHGGRLDAQVVTFPVKSMTGIDEASALEVTEGVRFGAQSLDDDQGSSLARIINSFLQELDVGPGRASLGTVIERPNNSAIRVSFKDKDVARIEVPCGTPMYAALWLFTGELLMACLAVLFALRYTIEAAFSGRRMLIPLAVAVPLVPLSMLLFALTSGFLSVIYTSLATDVVEVGRLSAKKKRRSLMQKLLPGRFKDQEWEEASSEHPEVRLIYEEGVPAVAAQGLTFGQAARMDDLAYIANELQRMTCLPA